MLYDFLTFNSVATPNTMFKGISKFKDGTTEYDGEMLGYLNRKNKIERYFDCPHGKGINFSLHGFKFIFNGYWKYGFAHGKGIFLNSYGEFFFGIWKKIVVKKYRRMLSIKN